jgi:hypothetical protein
MYLFKLKHYMWILTPIGQKIVTAFWHEWDKCRDERISNLSKKYWGRNNKLQMGDVIEQFVKEHPY